MENSYELQFSEVTQHNESHGYIVCQANGPSRMWTSNATPVQHSACREAIQLVAPEKPFVAPPPQVGDPPAWDPTTSTLIFGERDALHPDL